MRAIVVTQLGGPEVLQLAERPAPRPAADELLVRVHAAGINRADLLQRLGRYPAPAGVPADIPGLEYAGTVEAAGRDVAGWRSGDRVMGLVAGGAYAELVPTPAEHALPIPHDWSFAEAAALRASSAAEAALFSELWAEAWALATSARRVSMSC